MKKHPVDELFRKRLVALEKSPSDNAWRIIQEKNESREKPAGWIWYAAAVFLVLLIAGYAGWDGSFSSERSVIAISKPQSSKNAEKPVMPETEITKQENVAQGITKQKMLERILADINEKKQNEPKQVGQVASEAENNAEVGVITSIKIEETLEKLPVAEPRALVNLPSLPKTEIESNTTSSEMEGQEPAITIIVAVEATEDDDVVKPKSSKFSRVFRQLKNARAGERVDWDEVGFNPRSLVARVDDRLRAKDDKISEKEQTPKDRRKL
jgi:hypothetical protein